MVVSRFALIASFIIGTIATVSILRSDSSQISLSNKKQTAITIFVGVEITICNTCDNIETEVNFIPDCQIATAGCYCLTTNALTIQSQFNNNLSWAIRKNCFVLKITQPTVVNRPVQLSLSWSAGIEYVQPQLQLIGNLSTTNMICNADEPIILRKDCDANVTLLVHAANQKSKRVSRQPISLYGFSVFSIIVLSLCVAIMTLIIGWNVLTKKTTFFVIEL